MRLLDFLAAEYVLCHCVSNATRITPHCSRERVSEEFRKHLANPSPIIKPTRKSLGRRKHPWFCRWAQQYPKEMEYALREGLVEFAAGCYTATSRGDTLYNHLRGDYS